jgi:hypothetical protein
MREIRQSGSEGGGDGTTVSPYPYPNYAAGDSTWMVRLAMCSRVLLA